MTTTDSPLYGRLLPVVVLDRVEDALPLADALAAGGVTAVEITLRTPAGLPGLRALRSHGITTAAGTVLTDEQLDAVVEAGVDLVVTPGFAVELVDRALAREVKILPGCATPSDVMAAYRRGLQTVKLFPAALLGGLRAVDALAAPFPGVRFVPSGGVTPEDLPDYLSHPQVAAVSGSWIAPRDLLAAGRFEEIRRRANAAVDLVVREGRP